MSKTVRALLTLSLGLVVALPAFAAMEHKGHGEMKMEHKEHGSKERLGQKIREAKVEGYELEYYLIDAMEMMKGKPMEGHDMSKMKSHHLMVCIEDVSSKYVTAGRVGYQVVGPDKAEQKTMTMFMDYGFGADVDLKAKGTYKIKTKAVIGDKTLTDEFTYTLK
jgi:hypothetical protein